MGTHSGVVAVHMVKVIGFQDFYIHGRENLNSFIIFSLAIPDDDFPSVEKRKTACEPTSFRENMLLTC